MSRIEMEERGKALENEFFRKEEAKALESLRKKQAREQSIEELRGLSGISDEAALGHLVDAGVNAQTMVAFSLVPLVAVAWADGSVDERERKAVMVAAAESGIAKGSAAHEMLERMLTQRPSVSLFRTWEEYAGSLYGALEADERDAIGRGVIRRARSVAEAAGGFLGMGSVSPAESDILHRIEAVFSD